MNYRTPTVVSLFLAASIQAQTFTPFGAGCPGSAGVPALHAAGLPALGQTMQLQLTNVPPGSPATLWLSGTKLVTPFDLGFIGSAGCELLILPDYGDVGVTATGGSAGVDLSIPNVPGLSGAVLESQWIVIDTAGPRVTVSNGGTSVIDALPPPMNSGSVSGPSFGPVGTVIQVRVMDLGTTDPDDLCIRSGDGMFGLSLFRATSIVQDTTTGEDVISATLVTANPSPIGGNLMLIRGAGSQPPTSISGCLSAPASAWDWEGFDLPGGALTLPAGFTPVPIPTQSVVSFIYDSSTNSLVADVPPYPWATGGVYPPGSAITTDAHGDLTCGGGAPGGHFDHFLEAATVDASCVAGITRQTLAIDHAPQVQQAFDNTFGPGKLTVTSETGPGIARIRIEPTNPACTLTGGGGSVVLTQ